MRYDTDGMSAYRCSPDKDLENATTGRRQYADDAGDRNQAGRNVISRFRLYSDYRHLKILCATSALMITPTTFLTLVSREQQLAILREAVVGEPGVSG